MSRQQQHRGRRLAAMTDALALARECEATEKLVHNEDAGAYSPRLLTFRDCAGGAVGIDAVSELRGELLALLDLEGLSIQEEAYAEELTSVIVDTLAREFIDRVDGRADARLWLLELAVLPSPASRQAAFRILRQVGIAATSIVLTAGSTSGLDSLRHAVENLENDLFAALAEMLDKAVVVASTASVSPSRRQLRGAERQVQRDELGWVQAAMESLLLFGGSPSGGLRRDRLRQLTPGVIRYLVEVAASNPSTASMVQQQIVETMIATVYSSDVRPESTNNTVSPSTPRAGLCICTAAFERCCSLELLLAILYTTASKHVQQLVFMVLFDLVCEQLLRSKSAAAPVCKDPGLLWLALLEQDLPSRWLRFPLSFSSPSIPQVAKSLATAHPSLFDKSTLAVLMQLQRLLQINDYFGRSVGLSSVVQVAKTQEKASFPATVMRKVDELLASASSTERFRGELWLAELLIFGITSCGNSIDSHDTILKRGPERNVDQETDNNADLRFAAQTKLWGLVTASASKVERLSFAHVVTLFVRRLPGAKDATAYTVTELATCLDMVVSQKESDIDVMTALVLLVIDLCRRTDTTYADQRRLAFDRSTAQSFKSVDRAVSATGNQSEVNRDDTPESTASVLSGSISLDMDLLGTIGPEFFLHAAMVLSVHQPPTEHTCRGLCCGSAHRTSSDAGVCAAFALFRLCESSDEALARIGGLDSTMQFLRACDTRVTVLSARFVRRQLKRSNPTKYLALLRDLGTSCTDRDDGDTLSNTLLHVLAMLGSASAPGSSK